MNVSHGFCRLAGLAAGVVLLGVCTAEAQQLGSNAADRGQNQLRWTPHRAATAEASPATNGSADGVTAAKPTSPAAQQPAQTTGPASPSPVSAQSNSGPGMQAPAAAAPQTTMVARATSPARPVPGRPASVGLPADVPAVASAPRRQPGAPAQGGPARPRSSGQMGPWTSDNRVPGGPRTTATPNGQITFPGLDDVSVFRTPQGEAGRPVYAVEGSTVRPAPRTTAPLGGGVAPRFNASATNGPRAAGPRGERLAMNVDGIPSVMTRAPQSEALEGGQPPARLPGGGGSSPALPAPESVPAVESPSIVIDTAPGTMTDYGLDGFADGQFAAEGFDPGAGAGPGAGMWMGEYPSELHVESFYDDPYACEEGPGVFPCCLHDGRICAWLRQFGRPYYGWRWYRDFTASAGITSFQNQSNYGLLGNYGTNEYINWAMPFWNAFGVGWQLGVRGVQSNFQQASLSSGTSRLPTNSRQQVFVTTGFFTRAFEGRGLQGGAVYDYLSESYFENVDVSQIRGELSYVWGYHELGFWGAFNAMEQQGRFAPSGSSRGVASTVDLYTAFYRLHFGDANEARIWGGASGNGQGIVGSTIRAPMARSLALEGTFTYLLPDKSQTVELPIGANVTYAPSAWNVSVNLVWYPAGRARRSLSSPYRPLFDVADNGSMIRALSRMPTP